MEKGKKNEKGEERASFMSRLLERAPAQKEKEEKSALRSARRRSCKQPPGRNGTALLRCVRPHQLLLPSAGDN